MRLAEAASHDKPSNWPIGRDRLGRAVALRRLRHESKYDCLVAYAAAAPMPRVGPAIDGVLAGFDHDKHPDLRGVVVFREDRVVAERYYNREAPDALHDNGGNKIYVIPSRHMVVASAYGHGYGQRRSEAILKAILPTDRE